MNVDAYRSETCLSRGNAPASPATTNIHQQLTVAAKQWPMRNGIAAEVAPRFPVEIAIGIHEPVAYEDVDRTIPVLLTARSHVVRNRFSPNRFREDGDVAFHGKLMPAIANKAPIMRAQIGLIRGTS